MVMLFAHLPGPRRYRAGPALPLLKSAAALCLMALFVAAGQSSGVSVPVMPAPRAQFLLSSKGTLPPVASPSRTGRPPVTSPAAASRLASVTAPLRATIAARQPSLSTTPPQQLQLGPIERPEFAYRPSREDRWREPNVTPDRTRADGAVRPGADELIESNSLSWSGGGNGEIRLGNAENTLWLRNALKAVPILGSAPMRRTGRGIGFELGKWNDLGVALEVPKMGPSRSRPTGNLSIPLVSVRYDF